MPFQCSNSRLLEESSLGRSSMDDVIVSPFSGLYLKSLLEREKIIHNVPARLPLREGYMSIGDRNREAQWICTAARRLGLHVDSVSLAVALLDKVITSIKVPLKYMNCVAATCLLISRKLKEDADDDTSIYLDRLRLVYSTAEIGRMELKILDLIGWDAHLPSLDLFLAFLLSSVGGVWLLTPLRCHMEAVLCDSTTMISYRPSCIALSIVSLLLEGTTKHWQHSTHSYVNTCKVDLNEVINCRKRISSLWTRSFIPSISAFDLLLPGVEEVPDSSNCHSTSSSTPSDLGPSRPLQATPC